MKRKLRKWSTAFALILFFTVTGVGLWSTVSSAFDMADGTASGGTTALGGFIPCGWPCALGTCESRCSKCVGSGLTGICQSTGIGPAEEPTPTAPTL